jgi:FixJ family two-component response regulator
VTDPEPIIAVVDDESPVRTMLGRILGMAEYRVASFSSGDDFLASMAKASSQAPLCAIVDVHMPGTSGLQVPARLREARLRIPVILITASDDDGLQRSAREAGASCLLRKPFSSDDLLQAIDVAIKGPDPNDA